MPRVNLIGLLVVAAGLSSCVLLGGKGSPATTEPQVSASTAHPSTPAITIPCTADVPYTSQWRDYGGKISLDIAKSAKNAADQVIQSGGTEIEVKRSAVVSATSKAMGLMLDSYSCSLRKWIAQSGRSDSQKLLSSVSTAVGNLKMKLEIYGRMAQSNAQGVVTFPPEVQNYTRQPGEPTIPADVLDSGLPTYDFLTSDTITGDIAFGIGKVDANLCGGIILESIAQGGAGIKMALQDVRTIFTNYVDETDPVAPRTSLIAIYGDVSITPDQSTQVSGSVLESCRKGAGIASTSGGDASPAGTPP